LILEQERSSDVLISQPVSRQSLPRSPPISKFLKLGFTAACHLTLAITAEEEHEVPMDERRLEEISEGEGELHQSGMGHSRSSRVHGLGFLGLEEKKITESSISAIRSSKYELCIGSFGPIPFVDGAEETTSEGTSSSSSTCSEEVCSTRIASQRRCRSRGTAIREEIAASMERQSSERIIPSVCSAAKGKQANAANVGSYSLRKWLKEGSQGGSCVASAQSSCYVATEDFP
jgi:hypothetical protein